MKLKFELRDWQQQALRKWCQRGRRGIAQVVTGGGKTIFAEACILDFLTKHPDGRILIVVPTIALADQWAVSLEEELGANTESIQLGRRQFDPAVHRFSIMVINSARQKEKHLPLDGEWMLIVDECHRAGSGENQKALEGPFAATLGLSATPERQYDDALSDAIVPALGPIIYSYSLAQARNDGVITPFELINVRVEMIADEKKEYTRISRTIGMKRRAGGMEDETIEALLRRRARISNCAAMRVPVTVKLLEHHLGARIMVFHEDVAAAELIAKIASVRAHSITTYHTRIAPAIRLSNLKLYRRGVYSVLVSCRALDEGINIPETQVAIVAASTASTRQRVQRLGRVLRPARGKSRAIIYSLYTTDTEEQRLLAEAKELNVSGTASVRWLKVEDCSGD